MRHAAVSHYVMSDEMQEVSAPIRPALEHHMHWTAEAGLGLAVASVWRQKIGANDLSEILSSLCGPKEAVHSMRQRYLQLQQPYTLILRHALGRLKQVKLFAEASERLQPSSSFAARPPTTVFTESFDQDAWNMRQDRIRTLVRSHSLRFPAVVRSVSHVQRCPLP